MNNQKNNLSVNININKSNIINFVNNNNHYSVDDNKNIGSKQENIFL